MDVIKKTFEAGRVIKDFTMNLEENTTGIIRDGMEGKDTSRKRSKNNVELMGGITEAISKRTGIGTDTKLYKDGDFAKKSMTLSERIRENYSQKQENRMK